VKALEIEATHMQRGFVDVQCVFESKFGFA